MQIVKRGSIALFITGLAAILLFLSLTANNSRKIEAAQSFASPDYERVWKRTDAQVAGGSIKRTFLWGPEPFTEGLLEVYQETPGGKRLVQYFDKSRMEINNPGGDRNNPFFVTNGLIALEMINGKMQLGDSSFVDRFPASIPVAGDPDDPNGPTYQTFNGLTNPVDDVTGQPVIRALSRDGQDRDGNEQFGKYNVKSAFFEPIKRHNIAGPFWDFLNQSGKIQNPDGRIVDGRLFEPVFYAVGLPVTEAFWTVAKVAKKDTDVLMQCFERRCLTYTPSNPAGFQVEMGNVGRHYFTWRYSDSEPERAPISVCPDVPQSVNANVRPDRCVTPNTPVALDIFGFQPDELVEYWLVDPTGKRINTNNFFNVSNAGGRTDFIVETVGLGKGNWQYVFEGTSGVRATVTLQIGDRVPYTVNCEGVPESTNIGVRPGKCVRQGAPVTFDVSGFGGGEEVTYWLTTPSGSEGSRNKVKMNADGRLNGFKFDTKGLPRGVWRWTFEANGKQATLHVKVS
jgi:hypothetical protein